MLKLERTSPRSGSALTLRLREQERFLEPRLLQAFALALILHCSALLLFPIAPFALSSTFHFPPVRVQSDSPVPSPSTTVSVYHQASEDLSPPLPPLTTALDWIAIPEESMLLPVLTLDPQAFQSVEERIWPKWHEPVALTSEVPLIQLTLSGELAAYPLTNADTLLDQLQLPSSHSPPSLPEHLSFGLSYPLDFVKAQTTTQSQTQVVSYQVQMDGKTGALLWYERTESSGTAFIDRLTETLLPRLRFVLSPNEPFVTGTLTFITRF